MPFVGRCRGSQGRRRERLQNRNDDLMSSRFTWGCFEVVRVCCCDLVYREIQGQQHFRIINPSFTKFPKPLNFPKRKQNGDFDHKVLTFYKNLNFLSQNSICFSHYFDFPSQNFDPLSHNFDFNFDLFLRFCFFFYYHYFGFISKFWLLIPKFQLFAQIFYFISVLIFYLKF